MGFNNPPPGEYERAYGYAHNGNLTRKDILNPDFHALVDRWCHVYANHAAGAINTMVYGSEFGLIPQAEGAGVLSVRCAFT